MRDALSFAYRQDIPAYLGESYLDEYEDMPIRDMPCKHVMSLSSEKAMELFRASVAIGYDKVVWGKGSGICLDEDWNRKAQLHEIQRIIYKKRIHPVRVVVDNDVDSPWNDIRVVWIDNLHNAIAHILCNDCCRLRDIPHYIVTRNKAYGVEIIDPYHVVDLSRVSGLMDCAMVRLSRSGEDIARVGYTISDFMSDNRISRDVLTIADEYYPEYAATVREFIEEHCGNKMNG